jgi:hypothetical protein
LNAEHRVARLARDDDARLDAEVGELGAGLMNELAAMREE